MKNKIYKLLSIMLAVAVVLSCCVVGFTASATGTEHTYYVSSTGDDSNDGTTSGTPFKTYRGAIDAITAEAIADGFNTADDTVYLKVNANDATTNWLDANIHNSYGAAAHNFKLIITTDGTPSQAFMGADQQSIELNGPTVFDKCIFSYARTATAPTLATTNSLTINSNVQQKRMAGPIVLGTLYNKAASKTFTTPITFTNNADYLTRNIVLGSKLDSIHNADVNVVLNCPTSLPVVYNSYTYTTHNISFGSLTAGYNATFNNNVNFNIKQATDVTLNKGTGNFAFGANSAVQIINATGNPVNYDATMEAALFGANKQTDTYILNNETGVDDLVTFTATAGTYAVDTVHYAVTATSVADPAVSYEAANGALTVPEGEYDLSYEVPPVTKTYYVSASGDNANNGEEGTPFKTIGGALTAAVADADANVYNLPGSTVYLKVLGTDPVIYNDMNNVAFNFKLNISSATSGAVLKYLTASNATIFGGDVTFENIDVQMYDANYTSGEVYLNGKNVTFGEGATFTPPTGVSTQMAQSYFFMGAAGTAKTLTTPQTVTFRDTGTRAITYLCTGGGKTTTYNSDFTLNYDVPNHTQQIRIDNDGSANRTYYNANVNLNLISSPGVELWARSPSRAIFGADSALQIINSTGNDVTYTGTMADILPAKVYKITNNTGISDLLGFTATAGTYTVDTDRFDVTATNVSTSAEIEAANGQLVLTPGEYTLSVELAPRNVTYYVSAAGNDSNDGSFATPFQTIAGALTAAIADANANLYNASNSTVTLKLLTPYYDGSDEIISANGFNLTDASNMPFNFKLIIATDSSSAKQAGLITTGVFTAGGEMELQNVTLHFVSGAKEFYCNTKNFKMDSNVKILGIGAGTYFVTGVLTNSTVTYTSPQTVYYSNNAGGYFQFFAFCSNKATVYNADITLVYDAPNSSDKIMFDSMSKNIFSTVNKNMNVNLVSGNPRLTTRNYLSSSSGGLTFGAGSAFQMIDSTGNTVNYDDIATFLPANKYIITNLTDVKDILSFTDTAGTYDVKAGYNVTAIASDKSTVDSANGQLVLTPGTYKLITAVVPEAATNNYSEYIVDRGNGLRNTYAKLAANEDITVAYFGGSVTGGTGVANANDSWRGKIGAWLVNNFPVSEITNVNLAIGGTGSRLGLYRTDNSLLAANPDLVFIDFAINDTYDGLTKAEAKANFETIVRKIREDNPKCDIITVLVTDRSNYNNELSDTLYATAQAYDEISASYGIPTLYVGRALADTLADIDDWDNYFIDSVHPNVAGYDVYYQVMKEYFNNKLVHGNYDGTEANNTCPASPVSEIKDGAISVIKVDSAYVTTSNASGGSAFCYNAAIHQYGENNAYNPFLGAGENNARLASGDLYEHPDGQSGPGTMVVEFTGTELSILSMGQGVTGYNVSIDGGAAEFVTLEGASKPFILASGLESGDHTATVTTVYGDFTPGSSQVDWVYAFLAYDAGVDEEGYDVNGDGIYNICDLVYTNSLVGYTSADPEYNGVADKDNDGDIDATDVAIVRTELLTGLLYGTDTPFSKIVPVV